MKQYAYVKDGKIEIEGALPYFWNETPSKKLDMLSLKPDELTALGWLEVVEVNKQFNIDKEIQFELAEPIQLINGIPTRTWLYPFLEGVQSVFLERNRRKAEELRQGVLSKYSGQAFEYEILTAESTKFLSDLTQDPSDYPLLFSTIDATLPYGDQLIAAKLEAAKVLSKRNDTLNFLSMIRATRKLIETKLLAEINPQKMKEIIENEWKISLIKFSGVVTKSL